MRSAVVIALALVAVSCGGSSSPGPADDRLAVVTTVSPITNIAQNVGGDRVTIDGDRPGGYEQPHVRARSLRCRGARRHRRRVHQRAAPGGADLRARRGQRRRGRAHRRARRSNGLRGRVDLRLLVPRSGRRSQPPPVDQPALREAVRGDHRRRAHGARSGGRPDVRGEPRRVLREDRRAGLARARGDRDGAARAPQAPHLSRLVPLLRPGVRLGDHRRGPAERLRRPDGRRTSPP